jgi:hypothetical protein
MTADSSTLASATTQAEKIEVPLRLPLGDAALGKMAGEVPGQHSAQLMMQLRWEPARIFQGR